MDLRRLKTFVAVSEHGTISKAAQVLRITQPALSRQIGGLEQEIGFKLFERAGRKLILTAHGARLLGDCRSLLSHAAAVTERMHSLRSGEMRELKIATSALTIEGAFATFLHRYSQACPDVPLSLIEADASDQLSLLERGDAHLSVSVINVAHVDEHRFGSYLLPPFHILAACPSSMQVDDGDTIEIRRLVEYPLLLPHVSYATRELFDAACRIAGARPNVFLESGAAQALLAFAAAGHGIAVVPSILRAVCSPLRVLWVTHRGDLLQIALAVLWDKHRSLPGYAENFSKLLAQHIRETFPVLPVRPPRPAATDKRRIPAPCPSLRRAHRPA